MEKDFKIQTTNDIHTYIRLSDDDDGVWMTYWFLNGHVNAVLNKEQAKQMIAALQELVGEEQSA